jgi:hypothetical protein
MRYDRQVLRLVLHTAAYHTSSVFPATISSLSSIMPSQMSTASKIPKDGWVQELRDAESAAKRSRSAGAQLRLAIAAYKLKAPFEGPTTQALLRLQQMRISEISVIMDPNKPIAPHEYRTTQTDLIRSEGLTLLFDLMAVDVVSKIGILRYMQVLWMALTTASRGMISIGDCQRRSFCSARKNGTKRWKNTATTQV